MMCRIGLVAATLISAGDALAQTPREPIHLPNIPGYHTLKGDLHLHTDYSDGQVSPGFRVDEAVRDRLDFIALTDHIDFQGRANLVKRDYDLPHAIAAQAVRSARLVVIKGAEISPRTPPYHANAIFLSNATGIPFAYMADTKEKFVMKAKPTRAELLAPFIEAKRQGAFITYNHPAYQYDWNEKTMGTDLFTPLHRELLRDGMLHGIEVVNGNRYYGMAHRIALDHNLAMIAGSDEHGEISATYRQWHRPMTLVFSKDSTSAGIREALFARRTAVWLRDNVIGRRAELEPFFKAALAITTEQSLRYNEPVLLIHMQNRSDIPFTVRMRSRLEIDNVPGGRTVLAPRATTTITVRTLWAFPATVRLDLDVENLLIAPDSTLTTSIDVQPVWKR